MQDLIAGLSPLEMAIRTLEDFDVVGTPASGAILLPRQPREFNDLARDVQAAAVASTLGLSSIDYARRVHTREGSQVDWGPSIDAYVGSYRAAKRHMNLVAGNLKTNPDVELPLGVFAASVALERLQSGFTSAHLLYRLGFNYEGDAVARQVLEQIAWSAAAAELSSEDALNRLQPNRAIGTLKKLVPHAGPLYGELSATTHAGLSHHRRVVQLEDDTGRVIVAWGRHGLSALYLLLLADLWVLIYEWTQREHITNFIGITPGDSFVPDSERRFREEILKCIARTNRADPTSPGTD